MAALLLFHFLLIFGLLSGCDSCTITVQVSDNGVDDPSCVQNGSTCKTLTYALDKLSKMTLYEDTIFNVNITCNQTIQYHQDFKFSQGKFLSVRIIGHNNIYIIINSYVFITNCTSWAWIGLVFISEADNRIFYSDIDSVAILDCKIMTGKWSFTSLHSLVVNNSEFGQNERCPTLSIFEISWDVIFSNSIILDCSTDEPVLSFYHAQIENFTFVSSNFTGLRGLTTTGNRINNILKKDYELISVYTNTGFKLFISKCRFIDNSQLILVSVKVDSARRKVYFKSLAVQLSVHETIMRNNTATSVLVELIANSYFISVYYSLTVVLKDVLVDGNTVANTQWAYAVPLGDLEFSIFSFSMVDEVIVQDSWFSNNQGTPLTVKSNIKNLILLFEGFICFTNNTGVLGGACGLYNAHVMGEANTSAEVIFKDNIGMYGGALYLNNTIISDTMCSSKVKFINNSATTSGNSVYFATIPQNTFPKCSFSDIHLADIASSAFTTKNEGDNVLSLIPGQNIYINVSVTDYFGSPSSCTTDVYIMCDNWLFICVHRHIRLNGPDHVVLTQKELTAYSVVDTKLSVSAPQHLENTTVHMLFMCRNDIQSGIVIELNISACPLGFVYNTSESVCKCADVTINHGTVICSEQLGIACITQGYWYGPFNSNNITTYVSAQCSYPDCSKSHKPCPPKMLSLGFAGNYKLLGFDANEQCSVGRGGLLCKSCAEGYQYTFLSVSCVASSTCEWWQPYLVLVITLVFQLMIAMALMIVVRFKIAAGSGFLYGPMLFLAVISHLPLDTDPNFFILRTSVLIITAVPLLNPEPFGLIPWCFFHPFNKIYNYSLRYLGPLTVLLVIAFATLKARWCPRTLLKWQNSRLRALCILMLLSFWSLADITMNITFNILTSTRLIHNNDVVLSVVALEPQMKYFSLKHIPIVILALLVLLVVIVPLLVVLLISPALSRIINLTRIKPFLDEFQSCYKDSCRWYSIVYFVVWIIFVSMQSQAVPMIYTQALFITLLSTHCAIHPYQSKVLNITDTLILADINLLLALMQSEPNLTTLVLIHILVLVPVLGIGAWFLGVALVKCGVCKRCTRQSKRRQQPQARLRYEEQLPSPPNVPVQEVDLYESNDEREPLIGIVDDN